MRKNSGLQSEWHWRFQSNDVLAELVGMNQFALLLPLSSWDTTSLAGQDDGAGVSLLEVVLAEAISRSWYGKSMRFLAFCYDMVW
jgi:hypothetical protein